MSLNWGCHPNHLILFHPLLFMTSIFPTIRVFCKESVLHIRWPKYCSFSISPSNEYSGPISFRIDWFDLLAVQGTLKNLFQHHRSKASILRCSTFFRSQQKVTLYSPTNLLDGFWTTLHLSQSRNFIHRVLHIITKFKVLKKVSSPGYQTEIQLLGVSSKMKEQISKLFQTHFHSPSSRLFKKSKWRWEFSRRLILLCSSKCWSWHISPTYTQFPFLSEQKQ